MTPTLDLPVAPKPTATLAADTTTFRQKEATNMLSFAPSDVAAPLPTGAYFSLQVDFIF